LVLGVVIGSISSGAIVGRIGFYVPFMYLGTVLMAVGNGLLTTLTADAPSSHWIGYQAIAGLGVGFGMQQSNLAVQTCLANRDVPVGISIIFFFQTLGGAIFMSVGQNTFITKFFSALEGISGVDASIVVNIGATALRDHVPAEALPAVIQAYSHSVTHGPFLVSTITACLSIVGCLGTEWRSVKEKQQEEARKKQARDLEMGVENDDKTEDAHDIASREIHGLETTEKASV